MKTENFTTFTSPPLYSDEKMRLISENILRQMKLRRTIRDFDPNFSIPTDVLINLIKTAGLAPNGANKQPWQFTLIQNKGLQRKIRLLAEKEEKDFYNNKATERFLSDISHLGVDYNKPFLEEASALITIFAKSNFHNEEGKKQTHYYVKESVGIATGFLVMALHNLGLSTLTYTPSPMSFLNNVLERPNYEKPFLILVVGRPKKETKVPELGKLKPEELYRVWQ